MSSARLGEEVPGNDVVEETLEERSPFKTSPSATLEEVEGSDVLRETLGVRSVSSARLGQEEPSSDALRGRSALNTS
jgi:hypothetical protein